jgi:High-affinity nickel-transport protein
VSPLITGWLLALLLGARHASEPDHLVAVSTMVAGAPTARRAATLGAIWGIGHSIALLAVGGALMVLHWQLPDRLADVFELGVACMLLVLGARSIAAALQLRAAERRHVYRAHGAVALTGLHTHGGGRPHRHDAQRRARRPLMIGLVHGLAGSGALTALALANMPSLGSGLAYMAFFGLGSVLGMAALSGLIGVPLARFTTRIPVQVAALAATGALSFAVGIAWGWPLIARVGQ